MKLVESIEEDSILIESRAEISYIKRIYKEFLQFTNLVLEAKTSYKNK
jgi:hypothetical protein